MYLVIHGRVLSIYSSGSTPTRQRSYKQNLTKEWKLLGDFQLCTFLTKKNHDNETCWIKIFCTIYNMFNLSRLILHYVIPKQKCIKLLHVYVYIHTYLCMQCTRKFFNTKHFKQVDLYFGKGSSDISFYIQSFLIFSYVVRNNNSYFSVVFGRFFDFLNNDGNI